MLDWGLVPLVSKQCHLPKIMVALPDRLSVSDYFVLGATSPTKHEYWDGYLVAMAGASDVHVAIAGNLFSALLGHLTPLCRVHVVWI